MMKKLVSKITFALTAAACLAIHPATAADADYQVEILVFGYQPADTLDDEIWPRIDAVPLRSGARKLSYNAEKPTGDSFTRLPNSALQLNDKKAHLKRSPQYRILFHEAWVQPVGDIKDKDTVHITGGDMLDNGLYELEGYISIDKSRYLHFRTDLFHSRQLTTQEAQLLLPTPAQPAPDNPEARALAAVTNPLRSNTDSSYLTHTEVPDFVTVEMKAARRMRRNELHYIDHPLMGALVLISPVEE